MSRICVLCLGDHPSFECPITAVFRNSLSIKKEKKQSTIRSFCSASQNDAKVKSEFTPYATSEKSWAFFESNPVSNDDELWLTQKPVSTKNRADLDVFFVKSIVPSGPIPLKASKGGSSPAKLFANKSTSTMIMAEHLITLEDHEAILAQVLEQRSEPARADKPKPKPIKLKKLVKPKEIQKIIGILIFHH